jgi:2-polyprenyl-3-methyl-5-hydroxy-6-metoxy-1,4-benzoquinol methylase
MYQSFSSDYDRFVNWQERLFYEMPFIEEQAALLQKPAGTPLDILDTACGTGMHAVTLAKGGHRVSAADLFPQMVEVGEHNARKAGVQVRFAAAGLGDMAATFGAQQFDLLLCLGNSLPHLTSKLELTRALRDFAAVLRPGGMALIQNRNFDLVMRQQQRWMEPQAHRESEKEWVFQRFYDFLPGGLIQFNIVTLKRERDSAWQAGVASTILRPQLQAELEQGLTNAGVHDIRTLGSMQGEAFQPETSGNLILTARKA